MWHCYRTLSRGLLFFLDTVYKTSGTQKSAYLRQGTDTKTLSLLNKCLVKYTEFRGYYSAPCIISASWVIALPFNRNHNSTLT